LNSSELLWFSLNHIGQTERVMTAFTIRLADKTAAKLDELASQLDRSRAYVATKAIEEFVAREAWQLAEIGAGLAEAEAGDFASGAELEATLAQYKGKADR
jgi:predicted transcriptional regulator